MHRNGKMIKEAIRIVIALSKLSFAESDFDESCEKDDIRILKRLIIGARAIKEDVTNLEF